MDWPIPHRRQVPIRAGKGQTQPQRGIPYQTANRLPVSNQRLPEILGGWHPPGGSQPEIGSPEETQGALDWRARKQAGRGREKSRCTWRECASQAPGSLSCSDREGTKRRPNHKTQAQLSLLLCGVPENLNLSGLGLGSERNSGPAAFRAAWRLSSVDGESTHALSRANPVWPGHCECSPHTPVRLSAAPLPPHSATEQANLNKRPPPPPCVRAEIRHWRDLQAEAK